jgi:hypothetical protein
MTQASKSEAENERALLGKARDALSFYACHGGEAVPCLRTAAQCQHECGKPAADAFVEIDAALLARAEAKSKGPAMTTDTPSPLPAEMPNTESLCGNYAPDRIWLLDMGSGDVEWSGEPEPDGERPLEAVAYVRVASLPTPVADTRPISDVTRRMEKILNREFVMKPALSTKDIDRG